jgi:hypothetical protein
LTAAQIPRNSGALPIVPSRTKSGVRHGNRDAAHAVTKWPKVHVGI